MLYRTYFKLLAEVNDFEAARQYLIADDMTKYLIDDDCCSSCKDKIKSIKWILRDESHGYIDLETTAELTSLELDSISDWVSGQNSDGLGEGFEQQDFACYDDSDYDDYYDDEDEGNSYGDTSVMASFDWQINSYKFLLVSED